jgi:hypothetical protein
VRFQVRANYMVLLPCYTMEYEDSRRPWKKFGTGNQYSWLLQTSKMGYEQLARMKSIDLVLTINGKGRT